MEGQIRRRRFIIAIDETHEPFYGKIKNPRTLDFTNCVKDAIGSYKYIVVAVVFEIHPSRHPNLKNKRGCGLLRERTADIREIAHTNRDGPS